MVKPTTAVTDAAGGWQSEPSRFAYVDAGRIRERRVAAINAGLSPPITGWSISESYWEHWENQWGRAQDPGVRFETRALYVPEEALADLRADPWFRAVEIVPHRRTDSLSAHYAGELLLESEAFPPSTLTEPAAKSPNSSITDKETEALVAELKAGSSDISWAELMRGVDTVENRKVVAAFAPASGGFLLYADADPKRRMIPEIFPQEARDGEDPRYRDLPRRSFSDIDPRSTVALWG